MGRFSKLECDDSPPPGTPGPPEPTAEEFGEEHYLGLARMGMLEGDHEAALRHYSQALQLNVNLVEAWAGQVRALNELGEFEEALLWVDKALERFRDHPDLLAAKAVAHARQGKLDTAIAYSDAALSATPLTQYVWLARGECLLVARNRNARYCFLKALEHVPQDWQAQLYIGLAYLREGFAVDALRYLNAAVQIDSNCAVAWMALGATHEALGALGPARNAYLRALEARPGHKAARTALGRLDSMGLLGRLGRALGRWVYVPRTFEGVASSRAAARKEAADAAR
jgi:tetratricopeptide (TPR) repeat protein